MAANKLAKGVMTAGWAIGSAMLIAASQKGWGVVFFILALLA